MLLWFGGLGMDALRIECNENTDVIMVWWLGRGCAGDRMLM